MTDQELNEIDQKLKDHDDRIKALEARFNTSINVPAEGKQKTLREIIKGKKFKNGQEQIAAIVGYHEMILGKKIMREKISEEWASAKMDNKFNKTFIERAKDSLIRVHDDTSCDLTQSGEDFFNGILKEVK